MSNIPKKILFISLGGAGQRHLRIIKKFPTSEYYALRRTKNTLF